MSEITPVLEPAVQEFADANANPPQLYDLPVDQGRKIVDSVQDGDIPAPPVDITDLTIKGGPSDEVSIKIFRPQGLSGDLPVLLFTHGAGWVFGDAHTHGRLVAELATRAGRRRRVHELLPVTRGEVPHGASRRSTPSWSGSPPTVPGSSWIQPGSRSQGTRSAGI